MQTNSEMDQEASIHTVTRLATAKQKGEFPSMSMSKKGAGDGRGESRKRGGGGTDVSDLRCKKAKSVNRDMRRRGA